MTDVCMNNRWEKRARPVLSRVWVRVGREELSPRGRGLIDKMLTHLGWTHSYRVGGGERAR